MHAIHFQLKRAHLSTTRFAQRAVKRVQGMTPARYDILALLRENPHRYGHAFTRDQCLMQQKEITERLGLHKTTVSKMLGRMEEMGWITRRRAWWLRDKRQKVVMLTELGFRRAVRAMSRVFQTRSFLAPFERIARQLRPLDHGVAAVKYVWDTVDAVARFFDDRSDFFYPFEFGKQWWPQEATSETAEAPDPRGPRTTWEKIQFNRRAEMMVKWTARMMRNRAHNLRYVRSDDEGEMQVC